MALRDVKAVVTITTNAVKAIDDGKKLKQVYADINAQLNDMRARKKTGTPEFKELQKLAEDTKAKINEMLRGMQLVDKVMSNMSGHIGKDLNRALRETSKEFNKTSSSTDQGRAKLERLRQAVAGIKKELSDRKGLTMSFVDAQKQMANLNNTRLDKLKQGLAAIRAELDNPNIGNKWRRQLEQMAATYNAAITARQTPITNRPVAQMNATQLKAEQTALTAALASTSGVKGYEKQSAQYEQRLKAVNDQLKVLTENEKKADQAAKQLQATQEAAQTVRAVYRNQAVELEKLQAAYKTLEARQKQFAGTNDAKARAAAQQMAILKNRIDQVTASMQAEIKIDKQFLKTASTGQLQSALTQLQQKLQSLTSQQGATARKIKEDMKAVEMQIRRNTGAIQQQGNTFGTAIKNITAYVGVFGAFNFLKGKIMSVYQSNLKLSDSLADIRKVSGLTSQEIDKLYMNISKIDSRNTIETLNKLAYAGAKLGVGQNYGVEGLTGFVRAAEQVQMALGEDLGEDALPALAKLTEVMNLIPKYGVEQAMQKAASAIFQLGATSTATGRNIVEFSKRLMGLANVSRISADELLGIASASDALGIMPEVGATAFNKLFTSIQKGHNMIEKSLGLVQGSINENFSKGQTIKSIVDIFESMNKKGNMNALDGIFKDLGSDGARLVAVMTTMADRVDILKTHLATSTKAFKDGTAVMNEYMIQNETANALMERASNLWAKAFTNPEGVDMVKQLAEQWYEVSKALTQSESSMYALHNSLEMITNRLVEIVKILPFLIKMFTWFAIFGGIRMMVNSFIALVTAIRAATTATATLQVVMNSNWVLAGISAAVAGISLFVDSMNAAAEATEKAQKRQAELDMQLAKSKEAINTVAAPLESYKRALDDSNYSLEKRNQLLKDLLKSDYQQYLDYLGIEIDGAIDLAKAYAQVVKVLKQKKAYEEREQYRDEVNQNNKMDRMRSGMQFGQTAKAIGANGVDAEWLRQRHNLPVEDIMASVVKAAGGSVQFMDLGRGAKGNAYYDKAGNLIEATVLDRLRKNIREYSTSRNTENRLNREVDELYKEEVGDFDMEKFQDEALKGQFKRKGQLDNLKPDKDALKAQRKQEAEHKQALRKDLQDAKRDSDAIIGKIEEWYRLQETVVTGFAADGKWTQEQAEMMNRELEAAKNEALANARLAISGRDTQTWERTKQNIRLLMFDTGKWSQELFSEMMDVSMSAIRQNLSRIDQEGGQYGITTSSLKDGLDKNAAGNLRKVQEIRNKTAKEVEKALLQFNYFEQATKAYEDRLTQLGLLTETAEQAAQRLNQLKASEKTEEQLTRERSTARRQAGDQFRQTPGASYNVNPDDTESLRSWLQGFTGAQGAVGANGFEWQFSGWAEAFKDDFGKWLTDSETYKAQIQAFYLSLVDYDTQYYNAVRQHREQMNKEADTRWETSGMGRVFSSAEQEINLQGRQQKMLGQEQGTNFGEMAGFYNVENDPEIQMSLLRMAQYEAELEAFKQENEGKKLEGAALDAYQQELFEREQQRKQLEQEAEESLMQHINDHISKLEQWTQPIEQFGADVGDAMGKAVFAGESMADGMRNALRSLVQSWGESTIQIVKQLMMQQLKQRLIGKTMVKEKKKTEGEMTDVTEEGEKTRFNVTSALEAGAANIAQQVGDKMLATKQTQDTAEMQAEGQKATGSVLAGIAEGAAKIIGMLGPFGAPLIAVITALLMGLLNTALSALTGGGSSGQNNANQANRKVKLAQGMLTYDEGNLQEVAGEGRSTSGRLPLGSAASLVEEPTGRKNVQTVVGDDGRVYRAREQQSLPSGVSIVSEPIATRVNGQQALVAERGPEIVIGRRTTRAIQMNRPDLLRDLMLIDRGITTRKVRTFDEGNLSDLATALQPADAEPQPQSQQQTLDQATIESLRMLPAAMRSFSQMMAAIQQQGIPAEVQMFDTGGKKGLRSQLKQADKMMSRYEGK